MNPSDKGIKYRKVPLHLSLPRGPGRPFVLIRSLPPPQIYASVSSRSSEPHVSQQTPFSKQDRDLRSTPLTM